MVKTIPCPAANTRYRKHRSAPPPRGSYFWCSFWNYSKLHNVLLSNSTQRMSNKICENGILLDFSFAKCRMIFFAFGGVWFFSETSTFCCYWVQGNDLEKLLSRVNVLSEDVSHNFACGPSAQTQWAIGEPKNSRFRCDGTSNQNVSESAAGPAGLNKRKKVNTSKIRQTIKANEQGSRFKSIWFSLKNEGAFSRQIWKLWICIYFRNALDFKKNMPKKSSFLLIWKNSFCWAKRGSKR